MINPYKIIAGLILLAILLATSFYSGMRVEQAFTAERDLAIKEAKDAFKEVYEKGEADSAKRIDAKLEQLEGVKERLIIREIPKVTTRTIYLNDCIDDDGLQIIDDARRGEANTANTP